MSAAIVLDSVPDRSPVYANFSAFHARFAGIFSRPEPRAQAGKYLRALMGPVERRNGWQIGEAVGDARPGPTQRLLHEAVWSADAASDRHREVVIEAFGDPEGVGVVDETGFLKKGTESAGVGRQYTGTAGKVENCQIGVFVSYVGPKGHVLLERELYLPKAWTEDPERRKQAKIPSAVRFKTKPALAMSMLARAWKADVPMRWVTGDEVYGNDPKFRDFVTANHRKFVLAVGCKTLVWSTRPALESVPPKRRSRAAKRAVRTVAETASPLFVAAIVASWLPEMWHRIVTQYGEKGPIEHEWAAVRIVECRKKLPGPDRWLLARRSMGNPSEIAFYLADAGPEVPLGVLARVASSRYTIEQCFGEAKDDIGMDHYEVRQWPSWYRHITLCMMALTWLTMARVELDQVLLSAFRGDAASASDPASPHPPARPSTSLESPSKVLDTSPSDGATPPLDDPPPADDSSASAAVVGGAEVPPSDTTQAAASPAAAGKKGGPARSASA
jgi:SRSO17 transposase